LKNTDSWILDLADGVLQKDPAKGLSFLKAPSAALRLRSTQRDNGFYL
jgi:hypothetical protein